MLSTPVDFQLGDPAIDALPKYETV